MPGRGFGWRGRFRSMGRRMTAPRRAIINVLNSGAGHLSAEDIYMKVHKRYPGIGLTTVYRTLELLCDSGIISKHDFGEGRARYEMLKEENPRHHHLICSVCGRIIDCGDLSPDMFDMAKIIDMFLRKYDFEIKKHRIIFHGLCKECGQNKEGAM